MRQPKREGTPSGKATKKDRVASQRGSAAVIAPASNEMKILVEWATRNEDERTRAVYSLLRHFCVPQTAFRRCRAATCTS